MPFHPGVDGDSEAVFTDTAGSVTGTAGFVVTANVPFLTPDGCALNETWNAYVCPPGTHYATQSAYLYDSAADML